jgi:putative transposase
MRLSGRSWNHKRVLRVYRQMGLNLPRRTKRRLPLRERQSMEVPAAVNAVWSLDFMSDTLYHGRRFRTLNVLDERVCELLDIVIDTYLPSGRAARTLEQLRRWRPKPLHIADRYDSPGVWLPALVRGCSQAVALPPDLGAWIAAR